MTLFSLLSHFSPLPTFERVLLFIPKDNFVVVTWCLNINFNCLSICSRWLIYGFRGGKFFISFDVACLVCCVQSLFVQLVVNVVVLRAIKFGQIRSRCCWISLLLTPISLNCTFNAICSFVPLVRLVNRFSSNKSEICFSVSYCLCKMSCFVS